MDFDYDGKLIEALAEILGVTLDTIDMLGITIENDIGNDDFFNGYYVKFPRKEDIDKDLFLDIKTTDIDKIPWGETEYYTEAQFSNTSIDPFGYQAEWEQEQYEIEHSPSKEQVINRLYTYDQQIRDLLNEDNIDELKIKVLIFVSYSITEGYIKKLVLEAMPIGEMLNTLNNKKILEKLYSANERKELYNKYSNKTLKYIPNYREIRNPLSHDILNGCITSNKLYFNDEVNSFDINQIINELIDYINNPIGV